MESRSSPEIDDELFDEVYGKAYTGPPTLVTNNVHNRTSSKKSNIQSDDEDECKDPNAVPTDFTSREARVWEAKAKATERNWKKRKEEELICKICGESGHFTQGCPSTLGANRKSADFFERVPARDVRVRAMFSEKVIHQIEKDVGCKIKMDEKFLFVSGKDRLILAKGVDAVHKVIQEGDKDKGKDSSSTPGNRSRSPNFNCNSSRNRSRSPNFNSNSSRNRSRSPTFSSRRNKPRSPNETPADSQVRHSATERLYSSQRNLGHLQQKNVSQERVIEDHLHEEPKKQSRGVPQARAYNSDGSKRQLMHPKYSQKLSSVSDAYASSYGGQERKTMPHNSVSRDAEQQASDVHSGHRYNFSCSPRTLEELEREFQKEAMEFGRIRDEEEDEENHKHREFIQELRENYVKKLAIMRGMHANQWENFLHLENQRRQLLPHNSYNPSGYSSYDQSSGNPDYAVSGHQIDSHGRFPRFGENHFTNPHDVYGEIHQQRHHDNFERTYGRY